MTAYIYPPDGEHRQVAKLLLTLADDPREVRTCTDDGLAFAVPDALADRYQKAIQPPPAPAPPVPDPEKPVRRPKRPRTTEA